MGKCGNYTCLKCLNQVKAFGKEHQRGMRTVEKRTYICSDCSSLSELSEIELIQQYGYLHCLVCFSPVVKLWDENCPKCTSKMTKKIFLFD